MRTLAGLKRKGTLEKWREEKGSLRVLIWSGEWGSYWRAKGSGYTTDIAQAGIYTLDEAISYSGHCDPSKQIEYHFIDESRPIVAEPLQNHQEGSAAQKSYWAGFEDAKLIGATWNIREAWNNFKASKSFPRNEPPLIQTLHQSGDLIAANATIAQQAEYIRLLEAERDDLNDRLLEMGERE